MMQDDWLGGNCHPSASIKPLGTGLLYPSDRHTGSGIDQHI